MGITLNTLISLVEDGQAVLVTYNKSTIWSFIEISYDVLKIITVRLLSKIPKTVWIKRDTTHESTKAVWIAKPFMKCS